MAFASCTWSLLFKEHVQLLMPHPLLMLDPETQNFPLERCSFCFEDLHAAYIFLETCRRLLLNLLIWRLCFYDFGRLYFNSETWEFQFFRREILQISQKHLHVHGLEQTKAIPQTHRYDTAQKQFLTLA